MSSSIDSPLTVFLQNKVKRFLHASIFTGRYGSRTPVFGYPFNALTFFRFLLRSIFPFFHDLPYDRDVRQRQCRNENYQGDYPIESTHKIHSVRKAERACRGIPIQEKVRVIIAHTEIPIQRIAYAGKDQVIQRRYPGIKELFIFQIAFFPYEKVGYGQYGHRHMCEDIRRSGECVGHCGRQHTAEHYSRQRNGHGKHIFHDPQRARNSVPFTDDRQYRKHCRHKRGCAYPNIGLDGEIQYCRCSAHKSARSHYRGQSYAGDNAGDNSKLQNQRYVFFHI